jgi:hypothetical protein
MVSAPMLCLRSRVKQSSRPRVPPASVRFGLLAVASGATRGRTAVANESHVSCITLSFRIRLSLNMFDVEANGEGRWMTHCLRVIEPL